jgi:hypothetical protein
MKDVSEQPYRVVSPVLPIDWFLTPVAQVRGNREA